MQSYSIKRQHNGLLSFKKGHFSVKLLKSVSIIVRKL